MVNLTDSAILKLKEFLKEQDLLDCGVRIFTSAGG